jgi:hypothetical protein
MTRRAEILAGYERPYARALPHALRSRRLALATSVTAALAVAAAAGELAGWDGASALLALLVAAAIVAALMALWGLANGVAVVRRRTEEWHGNVGELGRVRVRRSHRLNADAEVAHREYAVAVGESGVLITHCFTPLHAHERVSAGATLVPGIPRYESRPVERTPYDIHDTARAAEAARELMIESRSTADALRGVTGQDR